MIDPCFCSFKFYCIFWFELCISSTLFWFRRRFSVWFVFFFLDRMKLEELGNCIVLLCCCEY